MKVLVACEFSGVVRDAFAARGHDAWSCDLLPTETPGQHIQGDVLDVLGEGWDLMIAHPPCTYLSRAGARWLYRYDGGDMPRLDAGRLELGRAAKRFFMDLFNADVPRIAIENPTPLRVFGLPKPSHSLQPYEYGHPYSKRTLLWLKNLPPLIPTRAEIADHVPLLPSNTGKGRRLGQKHHMTSITAHESSRTFSGVARAMAEQWGSLPVYEEERAA